MFLEVGARKSGKNNSLEYHYFELEDIVPTATQIFSEIGLIGLVCFDETTAIMSVVNTDKPEESTVFSAPMRFMEPNRGTNPVQALGASSTYMRRYLYMQALDIVESDSIEPMTWKEPKEDEVKPKKPATKEERETIKAELTSADNKANDLQVKALMNACNALLDADETQEEFVQQIAQQTEGLKNILPNNAKLW